MPVRLTETLIAAIIKRAASGVRVEVSDQTLPGLRLRITQRGQASWVLACRDPLGRMRRFKLGQYPEQGIAMARETARRLRVEVRSGSDPIADSKRVRAAGRDAREGIGTLEALLQLYASKVASKHRTWPASRRRIQVVFGPQLKAPLSALTRRDLQMAADSYRSPSMASVAMAALRSALRWAAGREYVEAAFADLKKPAAPTRRDRVLSREELARVLPALSDPGQAYQAAMRMMLLTLARREEVCGARWGDIDLDARTWRIDAARSKNKVAHLVPLSRQVIELLNALGKREDGSLVFQTRAGGRLQDWNREGRAVMDTSGTSGWTRHDLRRTGATMLGDMGETPDIIEAALNHVSIRSQIAATYNRSRYRPQVAVALQRLADALDGIVAGSAQVVPLRTAAAG